MNPRLGVSVLVYNGRGEFLIGQRMGSHGSGTWALPGGHLEFGESFEDSAAREVLEEADLMVHTLKYWTATNDIMEAENKHYITIFVTCQLTYGSQKPKIMEPEKCSAWEWVSWNQLTYFVEAHTAAEEAGDMATFEGRKVFIPILNLFRQRGQQLAP